MQISFALQNEKMGSAATAAAACGWQQTPQCAYSGYVPVVWMVSVARAKNVREMGQSGAFAAGTNPIFFPPHWLALILFVAPSIECKMYIIKQLPQRRPNVLKKLLFVNCCYIY